MPTCTVTWRTSHDDRVCPVCRDIDGYTWTFDGVPPDNLIHPAHGEVWNKVLGSLSHEAPGIRTFAECRCRLEINVDMSDLLVKVKKLYEEIKASVETGETFP